MEKKEGVLFQLIECEFFSKERGNTNAHLREGDRDILPIYRLKVIIQINIFIDEFVNKSKQGFHGFIERLDMTIK